jgi:hypothetical protein
MLLFLTGLMLFTLIAAIVLVFILIIWLLKQIIKAENSYKKK